ncbi:MAG: hypothetical protein LKK12_05485 [Bacteroidales bacterium]|nr:hypothetical protein [Bacteroidales bacterium]MCI2133818.1 hypothetical protein [Bacteroidales bacterium]
MTSSALPTYRRHPTNTTKNAYHIAATGHPTGSSDWASGSAGLDAQDNFRRMLGNFRRMLRITSGG